MLTMQEFSELTPGDMIEAGSLMPGLDKSEPVRLVVIHAEPGLRQFMVTFFGVALGKWSAKQVNDTIKWDFQ